MISKPFTRGPSPETAGLTILTAVTPEYEFFVPTFLLSAHLSNPGARICVGLEDPPRFLRHHRRFVDWFQSLAEDLYELYRVDPVGVIPNAIRFVDFPPLETDYVYFADSDIFFTESLLGQHLPLMEASGLPFSNLVRPGTKRLSGLHFSESRAVWAPHREGKTRPRSWSKMNDEALAYMLLERSWRRDLRVLEGHPRPMPGAHISIFSRFPFPARTREAKRLPGWSPRGGRMVRSVADMLSKSEFEEASGVLAKDSYFVLSAARFFLSALDAQASGFINPDRFPILSGIDRGGESK